VQAVLLQQRPFTTAVAVAMDSCSERKEPAAWLSNFMKCDDSDCEEHDEWKEEHGEWKQVEKETI